MMMHQSLINHLKADKHAKNRRDLFIKSGGFVILCLFWLGIIFLDNEDKQPLYAILSDLIFFSILWGYCVIVVDKTIKKNSLKNALKYHRKVI